MMLNEKQKEIIVKLAGDPELLKEFLKMTEAMNEKPVENEETVSLYVIRRHTEDDTEYYHPVVAPQTMEANPEDYTMIADANIVRLQNTYEQNVAMMERMTGEKAIIITIPAAKYNELEKQLHTLISAIYDKIDAAEKALDGISELAGYPVSGGMIKGMLTSEIMGKMRISGKCLNQNYEIEDAHEYVEDTCDCDDCDDYDYDDEYDCDDCDYDGDEDCDDCPDYGDCPCTR